MKLRCARERFVREESGFTLPEMLVTIMIMIVVLSALYSIFDMSMRVFAFGNDKVEAVENARLGLERMEQEIRAAYPLDRSDPDKRHLFFGTGSPNTGAMPQATEITFGNDLDGNGEVECPSAANCEYITYKLSPDDPSDPYAPRTLLRNSTSSGSSSSTGDEPVVEFIDGPGGLNFTYLGSDGKPCGTSTPSDPRTCDGTDESKVYAVRIALSIRVEGGDQDGTQTLTTDVDLRNRNDIALSPTLTPDTTPPDTTITSGPTGTVSSTTADFGFTSSESGSTFECRLDNGSWSACTPPKNYTGLSNGQHVFEVRARDAAGNTDPTPVSRTWTVKPSNRPPTAVDDGSATSRIAVAKNGTLTESASYNVRLNDTDLDNDALAIESFTQPTNGTVTKSASGYLTYKPKKDFTGNDSFTYKVNDGKGNVSNSATVYIRVVSGGDDDD